jgi:hypothetical protein
VRRRGAGNARKSCRSKGLAHAGSSSRPPHPIARERCRLVVKWQAHRQKPGMNVGDHHRQPMVKGGETPGGQDVHVMSVDEGVAVMRSSSAFEHRQQTTLGILRRKVEGRLSLLPMQPGVHLVETWRKQPPPIDYRAPHGRQPCCRVRQSAVCMVGSGSPTKLAQPAMLHHSWPRGGQYERRI